LHRLAQILVGNLQLALAVRANDDFRHGHFQTAGLARGVELSPSAGGHGGAENHEDKEQTISRDPKHAENGADHAEYLADLSLPPSFGVHAAGVDFFQIVVAENPGDDAGDRRTDTADGEDAQDQHDDAAVGRQVLPVARHAEIVVVIIVVQRPASARRFVPVVAVRRVPWRGCRPFGRKGRWRRRSRLKPAGCRSGQELMLAIGALHHLTEKILRDLQLCLAIWTGDKFTHSDTSKSIKVVAEDRFSTNLPEISQEYKSHLPEIPAGPPCRGRNLFPSTPNGAARARPR
jgi:hypothetical protein